MIGIFDSGLGGLIILKKLKKHFRNYEFCYFGDLAHLPYGTKSKNTIYKFTKRACDFLFKKGCHLIILACHTASAQVLKDLQRCGDLFKKYPKRKILGVTIPLCEKVVSQNFVASKISAIKSSNLKVGVLATKATCQSKSFEKELKKLNPKTKVFCQPAPLLVPIIEEGKLNWKGLDLILAEYLKHFLKNKVDVLIFGCTHYSLIKNKIKKILKNTKIISADDILVEKLKDYLKRHPEIEKKISKKNKISYYLTDFSPHFNKTAKMFFGKQIKINLIKE